MRVLWRRGNEAIRFNKPSTWFSLGVRGSGKSSFLEHVACQYLEKDAIIFDLFGSRDGEGLAWLRSSYANNKKILLLRGENVDVDASFPVKSVEAAKLSDFEEHDIVVSASPLYLNIDQEFSHAALAGPFLFLCLQPVVFTVLLDISKIRPHCPMVRPFVIHKFMKFSAGVFTTETTEF